jgi:hypothetical protein
MLGFSSSLVILERGSIKERYCGGKKIIDLNFVPSGKV